jgi:regulatory protein
MPAGTITALRAQANDKKRVNVFVDGSFALGVSLDTLSRQGLYVGKALSAEEFSRLETAESGDKAFQNALQLLNARPRSERELREKLARKGFAPEACDAALERLRKAGLVDDAAFARYWVENRLAFRPKGAAALRDELARKGIDRSLAEATLADDELVGDEAARAETIARAALRRYADAPDRASFQRRLGGFLQRRGFRYETVSPLLERLWRELQATRPSDDQDNQDDSEEHSYD